MANAESLAEKLEAVLAGSLSLQSVLADPENFDGHASATFYGLQHFLADSDIRAKDVVYRTMQEREMKKLIRLLRTGADANEPAKITFLEISDEEAF